VIPQDPNELKKLGILESLEKASSVEEIDRIAKLLKDTNLMSSLPEEDKKFLRMEYASYRKSLEDANKIKEPQFTKAYYEEVRKKVLLQEAQQKHKLGQGNEEVSPIGEEL